MITGDIRIPRRPSAGKLGILTGPGGAITGMELERMSDAGAGRRVPEFSVYAGCSPSTRCAS